MDATLLAILLSLILKPKRFYFSVSLGVMFTCVSKIDNYITFLSNYQLKSTRNKIT